MAKPQITAISSYFATQFPIDGVATDETTQAWRRALRDAHEKGEVDELIAIIETTYPDDETLKAHCEALKAR